MFGGKLPGCGSKRLPALPFLHGRYTVLGGVMPYLKTSRVPPAEGVRKGSSRTTPVRMPPPVKIPPSTPTPVSTKSGR